MTLDYTRVMQHDYQEICQVHLLLNVMCFSVNNQSTMIVETQLFELLLKINKKH